MNRIYRLVWNHQLNAFVVGSELAAARGKKDGTGRQLSALIASPLAVGLGLFAAGWHGQAMAAESGMTELLDLANKYASPSTVQALPKVLVSSSGNVSAATVGYTGSTALSVSSTVTPLRPTARTTSLDTAPARRAGSTVKASSASIRTPVPATLGLVDAAGDLFAGSAPASSGGLQEPIAQIVAHVQDSIALKDGSEVTGAPLDGRMVARDNPVGQIKDTARATVASLVEGGHGGALPTSLGGVVTDVVQKTGGLLTGTGQALDKTLVAVTGSNALGSTVSGVTSNVSTGLNTTTASLVAGNVPAVVNNVGSTAQSLVATTTGGVDTLLTGATGGTVGLSKLGTTVNGVVGQVTDTASNLLAGTAGGNNPVGKVVDGVVGGVVGTVGNTVAGVLAAGSGSSAPTSLGGAVTDVVQKTGGLLTGTGQALDKTLVAVTGSNALGSTVSGVTSNVSTGLNTTTASLVAGNVPAVVNNVGSTAQSLVTTTTGGVDALLGKTDGTGLSQLGTAVNTTVGHVTTTASNVLAGTAGGSSPVGQLVDGVVGGTVSTVGSTVGGVLAANSAQDVGQVVADTAGNVHALVTTTTAATSNVVGSLLSGVGGGTQPGGNVLAQAISGLLNGTVDAVGKTTAGLLNGTGLGDTTGKLVNGVAQVLDGTGQVLGKTVQAVTGSETLANTVTGTTTAVGTGLKDTVANLQEGDVVGVVDAVGKTVGNTGSTLISGVTTTVDGVTGSSSGIAGVGNTLAGTVSSIGNGLGSTVQNVLNLSSSSTGTTITPAAAPTVPAPVGSPGLIIGTGGFTGSLGGLLSPTLNNLLGGDGYVRNGDLTVSSSNVVQTYSVVSLLGIPTVNLSPVGTLLNGLGGAVTGGNSHMTLLGGVTSDSYIYNINNGDPNGLLGLILPGQAPAWASQCVNALGIVTVDCWAVNAAQDYQVLIGDGAYSNGSKEVVIGTNATHKLPLQDASVVFPGAGANDPNNPTGVPTADYDARLGHSVVIGDSANGTANAQTLIGAGATSNKANTVALGYLSNADRGGQDNYSAYGLTAPQTSIGEVAVGSAGRERQITHVAAGSQATDAVNVAQLQGAIDMIDIGDLFAVTYDTDASGNPDYTRITLGGATATTPTVISNLAPGAVTATSSEAINGAQLYATNVQLADFLGAGTQYDSATGLWTAPQFEITSISSTGGTTTGTYNDVGTAFGAVDGSLTNLNTRIDNITDGDLKYLSVFSTAAAASATGAESVAVGPLAVASADNSVALGSASLADRANTVSVGAIGSERQIVNVAAGTELTDAVNVSQLQTAQAGSVRYDANPDGSVDYTRVTLGVPAGTTGNRMAAAAVTPVTISNVANGLVTVDSTDAINGSQLYQTNVQLADFLGAGTQYDAATELWTAPQFQITSVGVDGNTSTSVYGNVGSAFEAVDGSLINLNTRISNITEGDLKYLSVFSTAAAASAMGAESVAVGPLAVASADNSVALGSASLADRANTVSVGAAGAERQIVNVAAGTQLTDAANVGQLQNVQAGSVRYDTNTDGSVNYNSITLGLAGSGSATVIGNLAAGVVSSSSLEAINGTQLYGLAQGTALHLGGGSTVDANGVPTAPLYVLNNIGSDGAVTSGNYSDVGSALDSLSTSLANINADKSDPLAVHYDADASGAPTNRITLAGDGTGAAVTIGNLAAGAVTASSLEAINGGQLYQTNAQLATFLGAGTQYDGSTGTWTSPQFQITSINSTGGTTSGTYSDVGSAFGAVDGSLTNLNQRIDNINTGGSEFLSVNSTKGPASATGTDAVALGPTAVASGNSSLALGDTATATADGSVALGAGSVADRDNTVSVGAAGAERQITNVAAGTETTDAVNVGQLQAAQAGAVRYDTNSDGSIDYSRVTLGAPASSSGDRMAAAAAIPPVTISNVANGAVASGSTDAINGSQLYETNTQVAQYFGGGTQYDSSTGTWTGPQYQITSVSTNGSTTTASYGDVGSAFSAVDGSLTNINQRIDNFQTTGNEYVSVNSTKAAAAATGTDSVAIGGASTASGAGSVALGDTASATAANSVALGANSVANRANTVSVGSSGAERQITNVAAGTATTDAVNVAQLQASQAGSVRYDTNSDGSTNYSSVTMGQASSTVTLHNIAAGTATTDAVNLGQLNAGLADAMDWSKGYTDQSVRRLDNKASAGVASAMAMAALPQPSEAGRSMASIAGGSFSGESGFAVGLSGITEGGRWIYKVSGSTNSRGQGGVSVGAGIQW
jgi:autotransporter adhesin